ncbi:MAG: aspartate/methionine/tyrosine aminotransferase [Myxococcota bacterium]|jgi:aspartate/methionine/tyrosine aminotransferase
MEVADNLNTVLRRGHPAAERCLSALGRRLYFPSGVTSQGAEAAECPLNATVGQFVGDRGEAIPLPSMSGGLGRLNNGEVFLYAPQGGRKDLRLAWQERLRGQTDGPLSLPMVTSGLTHGLSIVADLFTDTGTQVLLPDPGWGNYNHIFGTRTGAEMIRYLVVDEQGRLNLPAIAAALAETTGPSVLLLNFPSNPLGYTPTVQEAAALVEVINAAPNPLVVLCDDAYHGMSWEDGLAIDGIFPLLADADPERILPVKIDGATKELFFFGGRVGFITFGVDGAAGAALEEKARALARATISSVSAPSQAMVMQALTAPDLAEQQAVLRDILRRRYRALRTALEHHNLSAWPFNSAFFALLRVENSHVIRRGLLQDGVGLVAFPGALRLSYSTIPEGEIDRLVAITARHISRS